MSSIKAEDFPPEILKQLGIGGTRKHSFTKESVRSRALKSLAGISDLTQDQRRRVLEHALKVNRM